LRAPELKPDSKADLVRKLDAGGGRRRAGRAGEGSSGRTTAGELAGLEGSRGGKEGLGGSAMRLGGRDGVPLAASCSAASFAFASSSRRVGGSGGSLACSSVGGSLLAGCVSDATLGVADLVWFSDKLDTADN
jgi:hypothetical protein